MTIVVLEHRRDRSARPAGRSARRVGRRALGARSPARGRRAAAAGGRSRRARASRSPRRAASTTRSVRSVTAKIRRPSVLRMSGSSTPSSCMLVPEKSGHRAADSRRRIGADTGAGAPAVSFDVRCCGGGAIGGVVDRVDRRRRDARPSTPTPPSRAQRAGARVVDERPCRTSNAFRRGRVAASAASRDHEHQQDETDAAAIRMCPTYSAGAAFGKPRAIRAHARARPVAVGLRLAAARRARGDTASAAISLCPITLLTPIP